MTEVCLVKRVQHHNYVNNRFLKSFHDAKKSNEKDYKNQMMLRKMTLRMNSQHSKIRRSCLANHDRI